MLILYAVWLDYPSTTAVLADSNRQYNYFRDINVMIFFGFGFLMTFLRRYGFSAIGYTFLISALSTQWSLLLEGFFETVRHNNPHFETHSVGIMQLTQGLFCSAAVMISFGAILGKVSPLHATHWLH